ncbi:hypothetical protein [Paenibacillus sp. FSL H8-0537]|uniref:hypothetical protein n=1 Tax=Paenibacillus sp. FSL H8-0537 TaxID=2921399 RepID=UPI00310144E2
MEITIPLKKQIDPQHIDQLNYLLKFVSSQFSSVCQAEGPVLIASFEELDEPTALHLTHEALNRIIGPRNLIYKQKIEFTNSVSVPYSSNILEELIRNKILIPSGQGMYTYREPFSLLIEFLDQYIVSKIAGPLKAKLEYYPSLISISTLNKTNHFTSFPQHVLFTSHLSEDFTAIDDFTQSVKDSGGLHVEQLESAHLKPAPYTKNPAVCYHCYQALEAEQIKEGQIVTAVGRCSRYESNNHDAFGRLLDFSMREIIFVGSDEFVQSNRAASHTLLKECLSEWMTDGFFENANDPFFTNDYNIKSFFQRDLEMKYELRFTVPYLNSSLAVASSNYHGNVFGDSFSIKADGKPAVTGCLAFGLERWVLAFLAQYGLAKENWPPAIQHQFVKWNEQRTYHMVQKV